MNITAIKMALSSWSVADSRRLKVNKSLHGSIKGTVRFWYYRLYNAATALDYSQIEDVEIENIDMRDAFDFVDAYVASATYKGRDMTDSELDKLNADSDYVYGQVMERLY